MTLFRSGLDAARALSDEAQLRRRIAALFREDTYLGDLARDNGPLTDLEELAMVCALEGYVAAGGVLADLDAAIVADDAQGRLL